MITNTILRSGLLEEQGRRMPNFEKEGQEGFQRTAGQAGLYQPCEKGEK